MIYFKMWNVVLLLTIGYCQVYGDDDDKPVVAESGLSRSISPEGRHYPGCRRDRDCGYRNICLLVADFWCNRPDCYQRRTCVLGNSITCRNARCAGKCVNKLQPCYRPPCRATFQCFDRPVDPCRDHHCRRGYRCEVETAPCLIPPCPQIPRCVPDHHPPYGECSHVPPNPIRCYSHRECSSGRCCRRGNRRRGFCAPDHGGEKPGVCPRSPPGLVTPCVFDPRRNCISDSQCPRRQKCCNQGCNSVCKRPLFY